MVLEQMAFKFGALPENITEAVQNLAEESLREIAHRVLTAQTLEELHLPD
jgi:hypothetical protein